MAVMTLKDWRELGTKLYGENQSLWRFRCPLCGHVATPADWQAVGAPVDAVAFSCIGRYTDPPGRDAFGSGPGPCNYTNGGLFAMNPVEVMGPGKDGNMKTLQVFDFADEGDTVTLRQGTP